MILPRYMADEKEREKLTLDALARTRIAMECDLISCISQAYTDLRLAIEVGDVERCAAQRTEIARLERALTRLEQLS